MASDLPWQIGSGHSIGASKQALSRTTDAGYVLLISFERSKETHWPVTNKSVHGWNQTVQAISTYQWAHWNTVYGNAQHLQNKGRSLDQAA